MAKTRFSVQVVLCPSLLSSMPAVLTNTSEGKSGSVDLCTDTSDLRHFIPKTFRHHVFGAKVPQIFAMVLKCPMDTLAPVPKCLRDSDTSALKCIIYLLEILTLLT